MKLTKLIKLYEAEEADFTLKDCIGDLTKYFKGVMSEIRGIAVGAEDIKLDDFNRVVKYKKTTS